MLYNKMACSCMYVLYSYFGKCLGHYVILEYRHCSDGLMLLHYSFIYMWRNCSLWHIQMDCKYEYIYIFTMYQISLDLRHNNNLQIQYTAVKLFGMNFFYLIYNFAVQQWKIITTMNNQMSKYVFHNLNYAVMKN